MIPRPAIHRVRWPIKQVTKSNFSESLEQIKSHIHGSDFVAVSFQKTGSFSLPWHRVLPVDTAETAYFKAKYSTERFQVLQVAVCPFSVRASKVIARPFSVGNYLRCCFLSDIRRSPSCGALWIHSGQLLNTVDKTVEQPKHSESITVADGAGDVKKKRKKLKGKRAVVRWLKFFRWKKKKDYERMTAEEKILYKMRKARKKEERLVEGLKKLEPKESSETTHDPEILTPEEHFYFLKMGIKCKNYVPVGRRGIYQGVILNMHLHWKKHQTLKVVVKTFSQEEVKEIAVELARLSGGIVLDIQEGDTIIMYRGKNYSQPPTEIMSPRTTLSRKKALDHSKYRDGLRNVRRYIPRLEQNLELLRAKAENKTNVAEATLSTATDSIDTGSISNVQLENSDKLRMLMGENGEHPEVCDTATESGLDSDSEEDLSDIFETDCDSDNEEKTERPLYLDVFDKFPSQIDSETGDFEEHLRQVSADSRIAKSMGKDGELPGLDEVDRIFLQAASLLKKKGSKR